MNTARRTILVVTGDPGGARVLIPGVRALRKRRPRWRIRIFAGFQSFDLWRDAGFKPRRWPSQVIKRILIETLLDRIRPDVIVTGTSFENPTESRFRLETGGRARTFSVLDHWCNYQHRFEVPGGCQFFPDKLGVMDRLAAEKMAEAGCPRRGIVIVGHPVLEPFLRRKNGKGKATSQVLYLSEPISWDGALNERIIRYPKHNELTILKGLLAAFRERPELLKFSLLVRPHPLEPLERIQAVISEHAPSGLRVRIDRSRLLEREFARSRVVLGITSIALLQARLMGRPVLSLQPEESRGWIPDDILRFLPRIASSDCLIETVSKFIVTRSVRGKGVEKAIRPSLPRGSALRIAKVIEELVADRPEQRRKKAK